MLIPLPFYRNAAIKRWDEKCVFLPMLRQGCCVYCATWCVILQTHYSMYTQSIQMIYGKNALITTHPFRDEQGGTFLLEKDAGWRMVSTKTCIFGMDET